MEDINHIIHYALLVIVYEIIVLLVLLLPFSHKRKWVKNNLSLTQNGTCSRLKVTKIRKMDNFKHFSWDDIISFSEIDRPMWHYHKGGNGDWKGEGKPANGIFLWKLKAFLIGQMPSDKSRLHLMIIGIIIRTVLIRSMQRETLLRMVHSSLMAVCGI